MLRSTIGVIVVVCLTLFGTGVAPAESASPGPWGGIEIGSAGIKAYRVDADSGSTSPRLRLASQKSSPGVDANVGLVAAGFSEESLTRATTAVLDMAAKLEADGVARDRLFLVVSSGVVAQADRLGKAERITAWRMSIQERLGRVVDPVSVAEEIRFTFDDLTAGFSRKEGLLVIDIGSGNTKFGQWIDGRLVTGSIDRGSGGESRDRFASLPLEDGDLVHAAVSRLREDVSTELRREIAAKQVDKQAISHVILNGGAPFAMMAYAQSGDLVGSNLAVVNRDTPKLFSDWVRGRSDVPPDFSALSATARPDAERRFELSCKLFPLRTRFAALGILEGTFSAFEIKSDTTEFTRRGQSARVSFAVDGQFAWLRAFLDDRIQRAASQ